MKTFGEKLKEFAKQKGGVKKLAAEIGMAQSQLSQYITGTEPGKSILEKIKKAGCDMNWLLDSEDHSPAAVHEPAANYNLITEVEELNLEKEKLKEEIASLKEIQTDQALQIHSLKKENKKLQEENGELKAQS